MYPNIYGDTSYLRELRNFFFRVLGMMDITFYGAIGDGRTDNYANLQVAIDDANRRGIHYIYVPFGRFCYRGQLINMEKIRFVGNPTAQIIDLVNHTRVKVYQFGVYPQWLSMCEPVKFTIKNKTEEPNKKFMYIEVTLLDDSVQTMFEDDFGEIDLWVKKDEPLSTQFKKIEIFLDSIPEEEVDLSIVPTEDTVYNTGDTAVATFQNTSGTEMSVYWETLEGQWVYQTEDEHKKCAITFEKDVPLSEQYLSFGYRFGDWTYSLNMDYAFYGDKTIKVDDDLLVAQSVNTAELTITNHTETNLVITIVPTDTNLVERINRGVLDQGSAKIDVKKGTRIGDQCTSIGVAYGETTASIDMNTILNADDEIIFTAPVEDTEFTIGDDENEGGDNEGGDNEENTEFTIGG